VLRGSVNPETGEITLDPVVGTGGGSDLLGSAPGIYLPNVEPTMTEVSAVGDITLKDQDVGCYGVTRGWTNTADAYAPANRLGNGWGISQWPQILAGGEDRFVVTDFGEDRRWFDRDHGTQVYHPVLYLQDTLEYRDQDPVGDGRYVLTDTLGNVVRFYDFDASLSPNQRGQFKSITDPGGNLTEATWTDGRLATVVSCLGGGVMDRFTYDYVGSSPNLGLLESVTTERTVNDGEDWDLVRYLEYTYYETTELGGSLGDLKTAVLRDAPPDDPNSHVLETKYYRYYTENDSNPQGYPHALKYVFGGPSYARLVHDLGEPSDLEDSEVASYADRYLEYDGEKRVTKMVIGGAGSSEDGNGGRGIHTYEYVTNFAPVGVNAWSYKTTEKVLSADQDVVTERTTYSNWYGEVMLEVSGPDRTFHKYDSSGREILTADPVAVTGYDEDYANLVGEESADYELLDNDAGLIAVTDYYPTTNLQEGAVAGYYQSTSIKNGETNTAILQREVDYTGSPIVNGTRVYRVNSVSVYSGEDGETGERTTTYAYSWFTGTFAVDSREVSLPVVSDTQQNGSGTADVTSILYDSFGRPIWTKDAEGYINHFEYDAATGAVVKTIVDVDYDSLPEGEQGFLDDTAQWQHHGTGLHLVTTHDVDSEGRTTKLTDPDGNVTYTVYNDVDAETRVYSGWDATNHTPTGPTVVYRDDRAHGYFEVLTLSKAPNLDENDEPDGTETFDLSDIQSLSRSYTNTGGQVVSDDAYFNLEEDEELEDYSVEADLGTEGVNYLRTTYDYDVLGLPARTVDPAGTIRRTVHDALGRDVSEWVGTDDTPTSGPWSPENNAEANMVEIAAYVYDGGGVGDGNLTQSTVFASDYASYDTLYQYDWRNRLTNVRGPDEVATSYDYDNLDEAIAVKTYAGTELRAQTESDFDAQGRVFRTRTYEVDPNDEDPPTVCLTSNVWYNPRGLVMKTADPAGLFSKTQYDGAGRVTASYVSYDAVEFASGTYGDADDTDDDTIVKATFTEYSGARLSQVKAGTSSENAVAVQEYWYDTEGDGTGDPTSRLTGMSTLKPSATSPWTDADYVLTKYFYDDAGRQYATLQPDPDGIGDLNPTRVENTYDMLGRLTATCTYGVDGETSTLLAQTANEYNSAGQLGASYVYEVESGTATDSLKTTYDYDSLGLLCKTTQPNGAFTKTLHNGYGRLTGAYLGTAEGETNDPTTPDDDTIVTQTIPLYDPYTGRVWLTQSYQRHDGASGTGALTPDNARITYQVTWFDDMGRTKWVADYGAIDGTGITEASYEGYDFNGGGTTEYYSYWLDMTYRDEGNSESYILTQYGYDGYGRNNVVIDNSGKTTRTFFDAVGRTEYVVDSFVDFAVDSGGNESGVGDGANHDEDSVAKYVYNDAGLLVQQIALVDSDDDGIPDANANQVTSYVYAIDLDPDHGGSPVPDNSLLRAVVYPDGLTVNDVDDVIDDIEGDTSGDFVETTYNAAGLVHTRTDQRGVVHTYAYDDIGRLQSDAVTNTTLPSGVDGAVRRIEWTYDDLSRVSTVTSYSAASGGTVVNQIAYTYGAGGWGNVTMSQQSHSDEVDGNTPHVDYAYADGASNGVAKYVRLTSVTYPGPESSRRVVTYHYPSTGTLGDALSRLESISYVQGGNTEYAAQYTYLGTGTIVQVDHPAVEDGLTLSYGSEGTYDAWDRFGRVIEQTWTVDSSAVDSYGYGYDMNSNRRYRDNLLVIDGSLDETYTYDGLDRLIDMNLGGDAYQDWGLDTVGNWTEFNGPGPLSQERAYDAANQITVIDGGGWVEPTYDDAGNMVYAPRPDQEADPDEALLFVYDGWNRLVKVYKDDGESQGVIDESDTLVATYEYDGLGRRIQKTVGETTDDYYYNESWQVLETRRDGDPDPLDQFIWDPRYVDSPVVRFHDGNTDGDYMDTGDNVLYYTTDANWNVTALVDAATGDVVERYMYDPYGKVTVLEDDWTPREVNASAVANDILYAGYRFDAETGLYDVRNRAYHPTLGRWLQRDPAGYVGGMSLYAYVSGNPAGLTDPMGLCAGAGTTAPLFNDMSLYLDPNAQGGEDGNVGSSAETGVYGETSQDDAPISVRYGQSDGSNDEVDHGTPGDVIYAASGGGSFRHGMTEERRGDAQPDEKSSAFDAVADWFRAADNSRAEHMGTIEEIIRGFTLDVVGMVENGVKKTWETGLAVYCGIVTFLWGDGANTSPEVRYASGEAHSASNAIKLNKNLASQQQVGEIGSRIAGEGTGVPFRDAARFAEQHGGSPAEWVKMRSSSHVAPDRTRFETHWVENIRTGERFEYKTKIAGGTQ
jgi:RHS repeat-associated protein